MDNKPIVFSVSQGEYSPVFSLRQITVADDSNFVQKFIDVADKEGDEKAEALYQIKVDSLAEWAAPCTNKKAKDALDTPEKVRAFFAGSDVDKDWISEYAVNALRSRHQPTVSFF